MKNRIDSGGGPVRRHISLAEAAAGLVLAGVLSATVIHAQGPGDPTQAQQERGQFQGPGGGFPQRMPFVMGTIKGGDANTGVIVVSSRFGGDQTVRVSPATQFMTQATVQVSALQNGDQIQVQGVPTAITTSSITAGQPPDFLRMGPPGGFGGRGNQGGFGNRQAPSQAFASATGKVTSTSPLTIALTDLTSVVLKVPTGTKVTKYEKTDLASLKVGDTIMASGQAGNDGAFMATGIGVNMNNMGGFGGGPGSGFGGPGLGGPGGPGARPDGQGGTGDQGGPLGPPPAQ